MSHASARPPRRRTVRLGSTGGLLLTLLVLLGACTAAVQPTPRPGLDEPATGRAVFDPRFTHEQVDVAGGTVHYVRGGTGPAIVLLHGWPETWWEWHVLMPQLADRFTVIAVDLPGLGTSTAAVAGDKRAAARLVHDAVAPLRLGPVTVVGHDIGLMVGYRYAKDFPQDVRSFVAIDALAPGQVLLDTLFDNRSENSSFHFAFHATPRIPELLVSGKQAEYFRTYFYDGFAGRPGAISSEDETVYVASYQTPAVLTAGFDYYRALRADSRVNEADASPPITTPVYAVGGAKSVGPAVAGSLRSYASCIDRVELPDIGHWVPEEAPQQTLDLITAAATDSTTRTPPCAA